MSRPCCPAFSFKFTAIPNQEQILEETIGGETVTTIFPAGMVFSTSQEIANCIALEITEVEERQAICELGPIAFPISVETGFNEPVAITLEGSTPVGSTILYYIVTPPANGILNIGTLPDLTYIPDDGFSGTDSFTYYVNNGFSDSEIATVTIEVAAAPSPDGCILIQGCEGDYTACLYCDQESGTDKTLIVNGFISTFKEAECPS